MRVAFVLAPVALVVTACSALTSWDDVELGDNDAPVIEAGPVFEAGRDGNVIDGGPTIVDAGVDTGFPFDASDCVCQTGFGFPGPLTQNRLFCVFSRSSDGSSTGYGTNCDDKCYPLPDDGGAACGCQPGGLYCNGHENVAGDILQEQQTLWKCGADALSLTLVRGCDAGCAIGAGADSGPVHVDDYCR
ncbi:MAG TPA: hypothetical protein VF407_20890 [Polyangiaceae bacterium]